MTEKVLFIIVGVWLGLAAIVSILLQDSLLFAQLASTPLGILTGWAIVTIIENNKGGTSGNN